MKPRKIKIQAYPASAASDMAALLFVHGAYVNSTCWEFNFIPYFQRNGYDCYTVDLSGHGNSEGRERVDDFGLNDFVDDLTLARQKIGRPTIVVGHSMGARVLERFLENSYDQDEASGAVFLSPVPAMGTASSALQLALRYPSFLESLDAAVNGKISRKTADLMTKIYFSPEVSPEEALRFLPMLCPESQQAVTEMAMPDLRLRVRRPTLPTLVIGGNEDAVFPASMLHFLASSWRAELYRAPGAGHMLMLDPQWEMVAEKILGWMAAKVPCRSSPPAAAVRQHATL